MLFDLVIQNARVADAEALPMSVGIAAGKIVAIEPVLDADCPVEDIGGRLLSGGFIETHIHLDKSCLHHRCSCPNGTLDEAIAAVTAAKKEFTEEDVYSRAHQTLLKSISHGTTHMRTHVEVDPRVGLTSVRALMRLRKEFASAIDLQLCVFPQEGLLDDPGCEDIMIAALEMGVDVVGGAPYMDKDSHGQIGRIFDLAERYDVDIDFHLDFGLDPAHLDVIEVCRRADRIGWGGRVTVGHVTKFSALPKERFGQIASSLANSGIAVTVLPATDLFLTGRDSTCNIPRGVTQAHELLKHGVNCSISTNNVLNPFTPFGDCSLTRMANLYANIAQVGSPSGLNSCFEMITTRSAKLLNCADYGVKVGNPADLIVIDSDTSANAIAEIAMPLAGWKAGRRTFTRAPVQLHIP